MSGINPFKDFDWRNGEITDEHKKYLELYAENQVQAYLTGETDVKKAEKHLVAVLEQLDIAANIVWHSSPKEIDTVWDSVWGSVGGSVRDSVRDSVRGSVWGSVWDSVGGSVWGSVRDSLREWYWADDASFLKFFNDNLEPNAFEDYCLFSEQVTGSFFDDKGNVHLFKKPTRLVRNTGGRLHYDHDKAIEWGDGFGFYYLNGVEFDEKTWKKIVNEKITLKDLGKIENADQRAVAVQMLRADRLLKQVGAKLIDTGGKGTELYQVDNFMDTGETEYCMKMKHPSLDKHYIEWVEPEVGKKKDADLCQAVAFGVPKTVYLAAQEA